MSGKTAVVYDFLQVVGGAELFSIELARRLPNTQLIVAGIARDFPKHLLPTNLTVLDSRPLPAAPAHRALHTMWTFWRARSLAKSFDRLILSGHYTPLLHSRLTGQPCLYYAHTTPLPFMFEDRARTLAGASPLKRLVQNLVTRWLAYHVRRALQSATVLANSRFTATAFQQRLGNHAAVLYPPCALEDFAPRPSQGYFLSFARQEPGKRVGHIIEAFRQRPAERLIVASDGSENSRLRTLAAGHPNIEFVQTTDPKRIRILLAECRASIYIPAHEPFGISAVESLACGKPVIAARSGGLQDIVESGTTGWLIPEDADIASLTQAIDLATEAVCAQMQAHCIDTASRYDWASFIQQITVRLTRCSRHDSGNQTRISR
jgi:glycosyltransferase involved in cell wall biosynthesis